MLESIRIENYKSIERIILPLGRVNIFVGENGAGKSNILEAIALAGAAQARKLDNEFLASRGIRVSGPALMRSAFKAGNANEPIKIATTFSDGSESRYDLTNDNKPYSTWENSSTHSKLSGSDAFFEWLRAYLQTIEDGSERGRFLESVSEQFTTFAKQSNDVSRKSSRGITLRLDLPDSEEANKLQSEEVGGLANFIIYAPENSALRLFEREGQIEPLGINGEGLLKLLSVMSGARNKDALIKVKDSLKLIRWFENFTIIKTKSRDRIEIFDRFLDETNSNLDQRSANEGFLYLAFYFTLFTSDLTPKFFAVDNVDSSLNPKLCQAVMARLAKLAEEHDKQVLLTTHNPATLDGLDLGNPEHRLFVVSRGSGGQTRVRRFEKKPSTEKPRRLSELFMSGALGGLPKGF